MALHFDLVDLRLITHVAEVGSLSRGAERSNLSAPAASLRVKNMEMRLGAKLFHRHAHGLAPTWIGERFLARARATLRDLDEMQDELIAYSQGRKGQIRLYATSSAITEFLPDPLSDFLRSFPGIDLQVKESLSAATVTAIESHDADLGVISNDVSLRGLEVMPFRPDPLVVALPLRHQLSTFARLCAAQILDFDLVALPVAGRIHGFLSQEARVLGKHVKVKLEVENMTAACRMVEAGVGIAVVPRSAAQRHAQVLGIRLAPLMDAWADHALWICAQRFAALPPFAKGLVDLLVRRFGP